MNTNTLPGKILTTDGITAHLPASQVHFTGHRTICGQDAEVQPRGESVAACLLCANSETGRTVRFV